MSFANLKKSRGISSLEKINQELEKINKSSEREDDSRFWRLTTDKAGNGAALIRFLPAPDGEDLPFVRLFTHAFDGPGGWYIENSLTTINQADPVSEYNRELWQTEIKANQEIVRKQKRKLNFISNILVIKDPAKPENDGKVFLFKFGKKIFDKLNDLMHPAEDAIKKVDPINPFCPWTGANFELRSRKIENYPNYDKSEFQKPSAILDGDDSLIEELWKQEYSLQEVIAPDKFKSYDDLKKRLDRVLHTSAKKVETQASTKPASSKPQKPATVEDDIEDLEYNTDTSDSDIDYLAKLAEGDD